MLVDVLLIYREMRIGAVGLVGALGSCIARPLGRVVDDLERPTQIVADRATLADPGALSVGISRVWVNGVLVYADGRSTGRRPTPASR